VPYQNQPTTYGQTTGGSYGSDPTNMSGQPWQQWTTQGGYPMGQVPVEPKRSQNNLPFIILAAVAVVVVIGGGIAFAALHKSGGKNPPVAEKSNHSATPSTSGTPVSKLDSKIASQQVDPNPVTQEEAFAKGKAATDQQDGVALDLLGSSQTQDCTTVVVPDYQSTVRDAGCTQALRATYRDAKNKILAGTVLLNVRDKAAARTVEDKMNSGLPLILPFDPGPAKTSLRLTKNTPGYYEVQGDSIDLYGHYVLYQWAVYEDGHAPQGYDTKIHNEADACMNILSGAVQDRGRGSD
jgi:flagellar basal body-associated protein FliL